MKKHGEQVAAIRCGETLRTEEGNWEYCYTKGDKHAFVEVAISIRGGMQYTGKTIFLTDDESLELYNKANGTSKTEVTFID